MSDLTDKQARLESLKKRRDSGIVETRHGDAMARQRSLDEINKIIAALESEIAGLAGSPQIRQYRFIPHKGL